MSDEAEDVTATNGQVMTLAEDIVCAVDAFNYLAPDENIVGVVSSFVSPTTGAPVVSELTYSNDGKSIVFRLNATADGVAPGYYTISVRVSTQKGSAISTRDFRLPLRVVR